MFTRRSFIQTSTIVSAGFLMAPSCGKKKTSLIGLQLYTVRDAMEKDAAGTLEKIAQLGYNSVEAATYTGTQKFYGMDPSSFSKLLKKNDLVMPSAHYRLGEVKEKGEIVKGTMLHDWDKAVDDAAAVGLKYMVCAYLAESERGDLNHYKYISDLLNKAGETCKKSGIQLCYHNHDFEFMQQDGQYPYEVLLAADKDLVKMEIDLYWVTKAGQDPAALFDRHPGRFPLWHLKDMDNTPEKSFTEVGNGVVDFKKIFVQSEKAGLQYFFVEQDKCPGSPFDSIAKSISYVKKEIL